MRRGGACLDGKGLPSQGRDGTTRGGKGRGGAGEYRLLPVTCPLRVGNWRANVRHLPAASRTVASQLLGSALFASSGSHLREGLALRLALGLPGGAARNEVGGVVPEVMDAVRAGFALGPEFGPALVEEPGLPIATGPEQSGAQDAVFASPMSCGLDVHHVAHVVVGGLVGRVPEQFQRAPGEDLAKPYLDVVEGSREATELSVESESDPSHLFVLLVVAGDGGAVGPHKRSNGPLHL